MLLGVLSPLAKLRDRSDLRVVEAHSDPVTAVSFSHDGTLIVSCAMDAIGWFHVCFTMHYHIMESYTLTAFHSRSWDANSGQPLWTTIIPMWYVRLLKFSRSGHLHRTL